MKKISILAAILFMATFCFSQEKVPVKQDTVLQLTVNVNQFRWFIFKLESEVDSKKASEELKQFINANTKMVQPADKPKNPEPVAKKP